MKKTIVVLILSFCLSLIMPITASAANDNWDTKPVITDIYEIAENTIQIKWTGNAEAYRIYVDNKELHPVKGMNQVPLGLDKKASGTHRVNIIPIKYIPINADSNTSVSFDLPEINLPVIGSTPGLSLSANWDWKSFGIDPKDIENGQESGLYEFNYIPSKLFKAKPEIKGIETDFNDNVVLTFKDLYDADGYRIYITQGKNDERYYEYYINSDESKPFINKNDSTVTITLNREYLREKHWLVPEIDEEYNFDVQLIQYSSNLINNQQESSSPLLSQRSAKEKYTPTKRWKIAPDITYNSQDGEGSVLLTWDHDDNNLGCQYKIVKYDKLAVVKTGEKEVGVTEAGKREFEIKDLVNGKYTFAVIPVLGKETGAASEPVTIEVKADWITAPELKCTAAGANQVKLSWTASPKVEKYHIIVSAGSGNLLRYVNLDFKKYQELDVPATGGDMEYTFTYPETIEPENGLKLKFEIYGVRHAADNTEQTSSTSKQTITLK